MQYLREAQRLVDKITKWKNPGFANNFKRVYHAGAWASSAILLVQCCRFCTAAAVLPLPLLPTTYTTRSHDLDIACTVW